MNDVLILDDDNDVAEVLCANLKDAGIKAKSLSTGWHVMNDMVENEPPRVLITDIIMPEVDGLQIIEAIRKAYPDTKIIAVSGGSQDISGQCVLVSAKEKGANVTMLKPVDMPELERLVSSYLSTS